MTPAWHRCITIAALLCSAAPAPHAQQPAAAQPLIPAAAFYRPEDIERVALSPSGRWLAMATAVGGARTGLVVFDLEKWQPLAVAVRYSDADIDTIEWVNDERLVYSIVDRTRGSGDQRWWPGLFSIKRDGSEPRQLVKLERNFVVERSVGREALEANHELLHVPAGGGTEVIVGEWRHDGAGEFREVLAKRLDIITGRSRTLSTGVPEHVWGWLFDPAGEPRVVVTRHKGRSAVHWRAPGSDAWRQLAEFATLEPPFTPRFVDSSGALFVTVGDGRDGTDVLKRFDFATGRPAADALVSTPGFDFSGAIVSETRGSRSLGVRVLTDAETTVWFDKRLAALQVEADRRLPGRINRLACRRCDSDDMVVAINSFSDTDPGQIWVHAVQPGSWRKVGDVRPAIDPRRMGSTDFHRIRARDGVELPVWVTQPAGPAGAPRAAVVLVHGGPWVRGREWRWNADAQFLASRGYVVVEPEFRGSTGYGAALFRAGWRQWGRAMQDDVADALTWAVDKGLVDPKRVCIAGASYGGYATLMGLARHPGLYRCGVAWAAVTDPRLLFQWRRDSDMITESREHSLPLLIGDPVADAAMLEAVTPVLLAGRINAPLLLAFGGTDRRVPPVHGKRLKDALTDAGKPPEWVLYDDEGHGWLKLETRLDFARRLEDFLARNLR